MDRRQSLKILAAATGAVAAGSLVAGCTSDKKTEPVVVKPEFALDRSPDELKYERDLLAKGKFFTAHELATITVLGDIIIPEDEISGSASQAEVPAFIDFIVQDMPQHQLPLRGGLRWLDMQCLKRYEKAFKDCTAKDQLAMVDLIAYPSKATKDMAAGVAFFTLMRDLTASGFYTSRIGVKDIGYAGNTPNQWNGVPDEVLKQYQLAYTEKELKECVSFT